MAKEIIKKALNGQNKAIFLTPLRALANELHQNWKNEFDHNTVGIFTGDFGSGKTAKSETYDKSDVMIMTPEKLDACTRFWSHHWHWLPKVDLVIVDEVHLLLDTYRGPRLEGAIKRLRRLNPFARIIMLSATIGNLNELADWIEGIPFKSTWRPIPLTWDFVYFKKPDDKPLLLFETVNRNIKEAKQSLVFVQSRRRAVSLAERLREFGLTSAAHHAGFEHRDRKKIEDKFRKKQTQVLVTTSTLEMGLNLPASQVVLYDVQEFNGQEFKPLSTVSVWQRGGRAGRPGLDTSGEIVLFIPSWQKSGTKEYLQGKFEPIRTSLNKDSQLVEQILTEVASRLSRNAHQLHRNFQTSLALKPVSNKDIDIQLETMLDAGFLRRQADHSLPLEKQLLTATRQGRVAVRHMLSPHTVKTLTLINDISQELSFFDIALVVSSTPDCQPILPVDYEELNTLAAALSAENSFFLGENSRIQGLPISGKRLLSSLKMALLMREWTRHGDLPTLSEKYDLYPFEIKRLFESAIRILVGWVSLFGKVDQDTESNSEGTYSLQKMINVFRVMLDQGLDEEQVTLTFVAGIGPTWARRIVDSGITDIEDLAMSTPDQLIELGHISLKRAELWINTAETLIKEQSAFQFKETRQVNRINGSVKWESSIDPYRLRRSIDLDVQTLSENIFQISGGLEPHLVEVQQHEYYCDCMDFKKGNHCKHILAVEANQNKENILKLRQLINPENLLQKLDLNSLWYGGAK